MTTLRVTDSGVLISPDILERLGMHTGDELHLIETGDGFNLKKTDAIVAHQMDVAKQVMEKRRDVLRRLAE